MKAIINYSKPDEQPHETTLSVRITDENTTEKQYEELFLQMFDNHFKDQDITDRKIKNIVPYTG